MKRVIAVIALVLGYASMSCAGFVFNDTYFDESVQEFSTLAQTSGAQGSYILLNKKTGEGVAFENGSMKVVFHISSIAISEPDVIPTGFATATVGRFIDNSLIIMLNGDIKLVINLSQSEYKTMTKVYGERVMVMILEDAERDTDKMEKMWGDM